MVSVRGCVVWRVGGPTSSDAEAAGDPQEKLLSYRPNVELEQLHGTVTVMIELSPAMISLTGVPT